MSAGGRGKAVRIGAAALVVALAAVGVALLRHAPSEAYPGMPPDQRAYWSWISTTNRDSTGAVSRGLDLLAEYPHLRPLYLRVADECRATGAPGACWDLISRTAPPDSTTALYREAALIVLTDSADEKGVLSRWRAIARSRHLDPALARRVVDRLRTASADSLLAAVEAGWSEQLHADSSRAGAAFGLGYAAVLRSQWDPSERLLKHAATVLPDDPHAYRELGRVYFFTGRPDAFDQALSRGIDAATAQHDLEQALILRGNLGWSLFQRNGDLERAAHLFEEALAQSSLLADEETEGFNFYRLANVRLRTHHYEEALALLDSAEVRYAEHARRQLGEVLALRGMALSDMYRFREAEEALSDAVDDAHEQRNVLVELQAGIALAQLRYRTGRYGTAREMGVQVLQLAQKYRQVDAEIGIRMVLGDVERRSGNFDGARAHYAAGIDLAKQSESAARQAELYRRLARAALDVGDPREAQSYYDQLGDLVEAAGPAERAEYHIGLGQVHHLYGNYREAIRSFDQAAVLLQQSDLAPRLTDVRIQKAWALVGQEQYEDAQRLLEDALRLGTGASVQYRIEIALTHLSLRRGLYQQALAHGTRAADTERVLRRPALQWFLLHDLAVAHWKLGHEQEAERYFREAVLTAEVLRENLYARDDRALFVQDKVSLYKDFAAFLEEQGRAAEAFHYTERARSRSLADLLFTTQQGRGFHEDDPADHVLETERRLYALAEAINRYDAPSTISAAEGDAPDQTRAAFLRAEYERADSLYRSVLGWIGGGSQPGALYTAPPLDAATAQAILRPGEALVYYNLRSDGDLASTASSTVFLITREAVRAVRLEVDGDDLHEAIRFFRDQIDTAGGGGSKGWEASSRALYRRLVAPVVALLPPGIAHLHIVPEGSLYYLPFAALQDEEGHFLVERFTLSVTPSASILKISRERNPRLWRSILLIADPDGRLPGARSEAASVASIPSIRPLKLVGKDATRKNVEAFAEQYDILHFATHGNFLSRTPWRSHLELRDGALSVEDIGGLRLNAYLVTLSACETALAGGFTSDVPPGDEWVGLNQAFLAAGSPTVMASLWPIHDRVSSTFMSAFYRRLLDAGGKSAALAEVQRRYIRDPATRHPFYWAAFTVTGDPL